MADLVPVSVVGTPSIAEDMPYDFYITATNLFNSYSIDMLTVKLSGFPDMHWRDLFTSTRRQASSLAKGYDSGPPSLHPWRI